jgi:FlaA1/EpsC-like NDP-sugar epimerase
MRQSTKVNARALLAFGHDIAATCAAWSVAFWLRFNLEVPQPWLTTMVHALLWVVPIKAFVFLWLGLYRGIWRYASLPDLKRILLAVWIGALAIPMVVVMFRISSIPRSVLILDPILLAALMCGSRLSYRAWKEHRLYGSWIAKGEPVIVLGAGDAAFNLVKELARSQEWRVVGLLDDDPAKLGRVLQGVRVSGNISQVGQVAGELGVKRAIIAMPSATASQRRRAIELCAKADLSVLTVPAFEDLISGKVTISQVRKVEVEDLLGREPITLDDAGLRGILREKVVMVTGAGGSIGSELCRQISRYKPSMLVMFELSELALYEIEQEFSRSHPNVPIVCVVGDAKNRRRVEQVLAQYRPAVIFHAAAYKHVPLMEEVNAWEAIQNNVLGTYVVASSAVKFEVRRFVFISTDKAVNPVNVMGASKRLAEMICQSLQRDAETKFGIVRFGNVLGSTGSVIPKFHEQIAAGGPVTVTHPDIVRYFMSIPEAAQLVLQAGLMGAGGEIFVMEMGEPVRILDLAKDMVRLSGFSEEEIKIVFSGLRPGEKLFEELLADNEHTLPTPHPKLRIAKATPVEPSWLVDCVVWMKQDRIPEDAEVRRDLRRWVPEYSSAHKPALMVVPAEVRHGVS